jgi:hypothetical protein
MNIVSGLAGSTITYQLNGAAATSTTTIPNGQTSKVTAILAVAAAAGNVEVRWGLGISGAIDGDVTIQMPQFEAGAFATSYIPTTTTSLTRNTDAVTMTGTNFSDWFNANEGAFIANFETKVSTGVRYVLAASAGTAITNSFLLSVNGAETDSYVVSGGVQQARFLTGTIAANTPAKMGLRYASADFAVAANGGGLLTQLSGSLPSGMDRLRIGASAGGGNLLNGYMKKVFWYSKLTNAELVAFTK